MTGDGGFDITVQGHTSLVGAIIASTEEAIHNNKNQLTTGSLSTQDLYNRSEYKAKSASVGFGSGGLSSAGYGKKSESDSSITKSGISGANITITNEEQQQKQTGQTAQEAIVSINTNVKTGQHSGGLTKDWNLQEAMDDVKAQTEITAEFGSQASSAVKTFAQDKIAGYQLAQGLANKAQNTLNDPNATQQEKADAQNDLNAAKQYMADNQQQYDNWKEGGINRVIAHTIIGGLTGDASGALGAGHLNNLETQLQENGVNSTVSKIITGGIAAGVGGIAGGGAGAAAGFNQDLNNRQLHPSEMDWIEKNAEGFKEYLCQGQQNCAINTQKAEQILTQAALSEVDLFWKFMLQGNDNLTLYGDKAINFLGLAVHEERTFVDTSYSENPISYFTNPNLTMFVHNEIYATDVRVNGDKSYLEFYQQNVPVNDIKHRPDEVLGLAGSYYGQQFADHVNQNVEAQGGWGSVILDGAINGLKCAIPVLCAYNAGQEIHTEVQNNGGYVQVAQNTVVGAWDGLTGG